MEKWLKLAMEIQALAQDGLAYTNNNYDIERYNRLRDISAEMISLKTDLSLDKVKDLFCNEEGYQTPKLDTRAAIFKDNKIFYNDLEITKNVKNVNFKYYTDSNNKQDNTIVTVTVNFENYTKKMNYKIEEIY